MKGNYLFAQKMAEAIELAKEVTRHPLVGRRMVVKNNRMIREYETYARGYLKGVEVIILTAPYTEVIEGKNVLFVRVHSFGSGLDYTLPFREDSLISEEI